MYYTKFFKPLSLLLLFTTTSLFAQSRVVRGKITSADGQPVENASISVVGTENSVSSKADGTYALVIDPSAIQLQVTAKGFKNKTVDLVTGEELNITIDPDPLGLEGVSITAVAIKREKRSLGYATSQVSGEEVSQGRDRSAFNGLQGKVAGLQITSTGGTPGSSTRIQLRGATSINGDNQPLIVVDGIPIDNSSIQNADNLNNQVDRGNRANDINPDDIESIEVLKGPAAAVLYGSRASNGAIIITTKTGRGSIGGNNKMAMTYNTSYSFEDILKYPTYQNEFGQGGGGQPDSRENFSWGPKFDGVTRPWGQAINGQQKIKPYSALPDNVRSFFDIGHTLQNSLSMNGGGERLGYYFSIADLRSTSVIPGTEYNRSSLKGSAYAQLANNFTGNISVTYTRSNSNVSTQGQSYSFYDQVIQTPRDIPLHELKDLNDPFNTLSGYYGAYTLNPYYILASARNNNVVDNVLGMASLAYKVNNWFDITYRLGQNFYTDSRYSYEPKIEGITGQNASHATNVGFYSEAIYRVSDATSDLIANIRRPITKDIKLNVIAGHNVRWRTVNSTAAQTSGLVIANYYNLENSKDRPTVENALSQNRLVGLYADLGFSYKNWLYLNLTGRNDWSSTLPESKRSYFYSGASMAWIMTSTFKVPTWWTYGKLRIATATVGKDAPAYQLSSIFSTGLIESGYPNALIRSPYGTVTGYERGNRIGNPNLKPEFSSSREIGIELAFLKNDRIGLDATWYTTETKDIIMNVPLAPSTGFTSQTINAASFTNNGIELLLKITPVLIKDFRWNFSFNFGRNRNEVTSLYPGVDQVSLGGLSAAAVVATVGRPFGTFYVIGREYNDGKLVVDSATGMPDVGTQPQYLGTFNPKYTFSIANTFKYKNWSLYIQFDRKEGGVMYSRTKGVLEFVGVTENTLNVNGSGSNREPEVLANSVYRTYDGKYITNTVPVTAQDYWTDQSDNVRNVIDASFTKLREVSLNYSLPKAWLARSPFGSLVIGVAGRNLMIWTPKENTFVDPETNSFGTGNVQGFEFSSMPTLKTLTFNLKVTF